MLQLADLPRPGRLRHLNGLVVTVPSCHRAIVHITSSLSRKPHPLCSRQSKHDHRILRLCYILCPIPPAGGKRPLSSRPSLELGLLVDGREVFLASFEGYRAHIQEPHLLASDLLVSKIPS